METREKAVTLSTERSTLSGTIKKVYFHNDESGYIIFRLQLDSTKDLPACVDKTDMIRCVGTSIALQLNDSVQITGKFTKHPQYGVQFEFDTIEKTLPTSINGIIDYLSSGAIDGIYRSLAKKITDKFGQSTIEILDKHPEKLKTIKGIGNKNYETIIESWKKQRISTNTILFLKPFGFSIHTCMLILKQYGFDAIEKIKENPYALALDIKGISFDHADLLGQSLGFEEKSFVRLEALFVCTLRDATRSGHVFLPKNILSQIIRKKLSISDEEIDDILFSLQEKKRVFCESNTHLRRLAQAIPDAAEKQHILSQTENEETAVYLGRFYEYEKVIAADLNAILEAPKSIDIKQPDALAEEVISAQAITLAKAQREAVIMAAKTKVLVVTGGPGTGKTTTINSVIKLFEKAKAAILLAAPTGRAARRMHETTGREAKTIHRMLEFSPQEGGFTRCEDNPLNCDLLVVDEASMLDISLFYHLLKAIPRGCTLLLVGDIFQLPSVGPGSILSDIIHSNTVPVVRLVRIFRQDEESAIVHNAHMINEGCVPPLAGHAKDYYFMEENDSEKCAETIVDLVAERLPKYYKIDPLNDIQVLSPMHKGNVGITELNKRIQQRINKNAIEVKRTEYTYRLNDKVMQIHNDYEKDVFNGDIGIITEMDTDQRILVISFDEKKVPYAFDELDDVIPAYAISIHKSQGSEYPCVIIPMSLSHSWMLERNLIYTAVTRGKKLVIIIGEYAAYKRAILTNTMRKRFTRLELRLLLAPVDCIESSFLTAVETTEEHVKNTQEDTAILEENDESEDDIVSFDTSTTEQTPPFVSVRGNRKRIL